MIFNVAPTAKSVSYNNKNSRLRGTNIQEAIDELSQAMICIISGNAQTYSDALVGCQTKYPEGFTADNCIATPPMIKPQGGAWRHDEKATVILQEDVNRIQFNYIGDGYYDYKYALIKA